MQLVDGAGDVELSRGFKLVERAKSADVTTSSSVSSGCDWKGSFLTV